MNLNDLFDRVSKEELERTIRQGINRRDFGLAWRIQEDKIELIDLPTQLAWEDLRFQFSCDPDITLDYINYKYLLSRGLLDAIFDHASV